MLTRRRRALTPAMNSNGWAVHARTFSMVEGRWQVNEEVATTPELGKVPDAMPVSASVRRIKPSLSSGGENRRRVPRRSRPVGAITRGRGGLAVPL